MPFSSMAVRQLGKAKKRQQQQRRLQRLGAPGDGQMAALLAGSLAFAAGAMALNGVVSGVMAKRGLEDLEDGNLIAGISLTAAPVISLLGSGVAIIATGGLGAILLAPMAIGAWIGWANTPGRGTF